MDAHEDSSKQQQLEQALTPVVAGSTLGRYEQWVLKNTSVARNLETMLYIAPQFVPKNLVDAEVASQSGYAVVGLLGLFHDYVLYKAAHADAKPSTSFTRMVRVPLSLVSHVQVLSEVIARKVGGEVSRWRVIVLIELFKCVCKLLLLTQERRALLVGVGKYKSIHPPGTKKSPFARFSKSNKQRGSRTGKIFANKNATADAAPAEPTPEDKPAGPTAITFADPTVSVPDVANEKKLLAGEILHVFRPLVYAVLRQRRDENSWLPALVALAIEVSGLVLSSTSLENSKLVTPTTLPQNKKAQEELSARKMQLLLYLLRDPAYVNLTKPVATTVCGVTDYVPVLGKVFRLVSIGLMDYYARFHFYTSAS
ncbi:hypothetical protein Poli38472_005620 [Pythium oligandrum]|uniref:Peroxisomal membrane protein PEX16 n=1 Tax=Pythium oligandrum TaxID=41045 RepID=A0A8K1FKN1_PYTOL|nr:hypothetical protein Poli38472_005620 [Pythium oligandrum]|eukprot:TMW63002.1 hypothetical protein Poli38472_005620 [Pythium oligandrum]